MSYNVTHPNIVYEFTSKYGVTHSNIVYRFSLDYEDFSSILYTLIYSTLPCDLVRVYPLRPLISSSIDYTSHPPAGYIMRPYTNIYSPAIFRP